MKNLMTIGALAALSISVSACDTWNSMWHDDGESSNNRAMHNSSVNHNNGDMDANTNRDRYDNMKENYPGDWYQSPTIRHRDR